MINLIPSREEQYNDTLARLYTWKYPDKKSIEATFQVTEGCTLCCTYCYQHDKSPKRMSFETAKAFCDCLFNAYKDTHFAVVLEFIGGEPLLEPELICEITDYWKYFCIMHMDEVPWYKFTRFSLCTNGTEWDKPEVQNMVKKIGNQTSMTVTIDGNQELHDMCRVHPDGRGSYVEAKHAADEIERTLHIKLGSKVTISPQNLPLLYNAIKYYMDEGKEIINANTVYEDVWKPEDAKLFYEQLKKIADYKIENYPSVELSLFSDLLFSPEDPEELQTYCGGNGKMVACDPDGNIYPCLRYMPSSVGKGREDYLTIGNIKDGIDLKKVDELLCVDRRSYSDDECFDCPIGRGCGNCQAYNWETYGTLNHRTKFHCQMHQARALANVYYWNKLYRKYESINRFKNYVPKDWALQIISEDEWNMLEEIAS